MRIRGLLSAACFILLLTNATDEQLLLRDSEYSTGSDQLQLSCEERLSHWLEISQHHNINYFFIARYLNKPTERQTQPAYCLPINDRLYSLAVSLRLLNYDEQSSFAHLRVKQHYESNLIYRFIHSRNNSLSS